MGGSDYTVRAARRGDLERLPHVEHAAAQMFLATRYPEIAAEEPTSVESFERWLDLGEIFVAVDSRDAPVGFAMARELDGDAYLHEIDVHPEHGRRGVGRLLVETVRCWAARCGHSRVVLSTFLDVAWNAPYYRRLGFRELPDGALGPGLLEVRRHEAAAHLDVARRVFMVLPVEQPT